MISGPTCVLLVEDDPVDAGLIQAALTSVDHSSFQVEWVTRLSDALARLGKGGVEVILLDLRLPDGRSLEAFDQVLQAAPNVPILMLSAARDEESARLAVQCGAHHELSKNPSDFYWLPRALRCAMGRKGNEDAWLNSDVRFRAISEASPLGIFVSDARGACVYTNAAYQEIAGLTFEQALGTSWNEAIHPEDRRRVMAEWRETARGQAPFQTEVRFLRKDGSVVWTRVNSAALRDQAGPHAYVQTVEDITERISAALALRAAEEALFEEKELAQVTLNSIGDAVVATNLLGNVTYLNLMAETMTGWCREEALGRPLAEVFKIIDGMTREAAADPARRAMEEDRTVGLAMDCVLIRRDGC